MGNMFNLFGTGGGKSEGLYIWKKYKDDVIEQTDFSFTYNHNTGANVVTINSANFDTSKINADNYIDFFDGFSGKNSNGWTSTFTKGTDGKLYLTDNSSIYYDFVSSTSSSINLYMSSSMYSAFTIQMAYSGTKYYRRDFIGYAVSDDPSAYPDKAEQDGFYYEKIEFTPESFGCTKMSSGSFTLTSTTSSTKVTHNLGIAPKAFFVAAAYGESPENTLFCVGIVLDDGQTGTCGLNVDDSTISNATTGASSTITTELTIYSEQYFSANVKYNYLIVA